MARLHAFIAPVLLATLWAARSHAAGSCDRVVSYFMYPYHGSALRSDEWRIYDPTRGTDAHFLSAPHGFDGIRWDTTFASVWYDTGDSVFRVAWRMGARPQSVTRLPAGCVRWWFDADSGCWQALSAAKPPRTDDTYVDRYGGELWQSSPDGASWRLLRADSVEFADPDAGRWQWADGSPVGREAPVVTLDDLASETREEAWRGKTAFIDTATLAVTKRSDDYDADQWFFLGLQSEARRGIVFQLSGPLAPEHDWMGVEGPFYLVDLDRRSRIPVPGSDAGIMRSLVAEHCGLLLVPGVTGNPRLIDSSGHVVFSQTWNAERAVWVPAPRRP